jgi:hypothetical protein
MPFCWLQRFASFVTAFFFLVAATDFRPPAQADDPAPAQAAHESAVLDRIFANWKARHDRVRSVHITWDCRTTFRKGSQNPLTTRVASLDRELLFEQFGAQLWIDGDDHVCLVGTPNFKVPHPKPTNTRRVVSRKVIVGKTMSLYWAGSIYATGDPQPSVIGPHAILAPSVTVDRWMLDPSYQAILLTFRPQASPLSWLRDRCDLVDENSAVENGHAVKCQRVVPSTGRFYPKRTEACWVSPLRDDVVVHWTIESPPHGDWVGSIRYKKDGTCGWIPSEWSCESPGEVLYEYRVTSHAINETIEPAVFSQGFPAGTPVEDQSNGIRPKQIHRYMIEPDGSKRAISQEEYLRLANVYDTPPQNPPKKPAPAKPGGN